MKRTICIIFITAIFTCLIKSERASARDKNTIIGINTGLFVPSNESWVQGYKIIGYDANGSPEYLIISGFGNGGVLNLSVSHYFSDIGISLKSGAYILRQQTDMSLAPDGERTAYDNTFDIIPVELSVDYKIDLDESGVIPYFGMGIGVYYGSIEQKFMPENAQRTWTSGSAFSGGIVYYSGLIIPLYYDLLLNLRAGYHVALGNWELKNQDDQTVTRHEKLNTGGLTFNLGLALRF